MSFDVYAQGFRDGDARPGGGERARQVLAPFVVEPDGAHGFLRLALGDDTADVHLRADGMLVTHVTGATLWEPLVAGARAADWVVLPVGCPTCLTAEHQRRHLPDGLADDVRLVLTGADLVRVVTGS